MTRDFWQGKRVLVTGHTGFKGCWLVLWLRRLGAEVTGYALDPPISPSLFELTNSERNISSTLGDIGDLDALNRCLSDAQPEIVFHLAAQSLVKASYGDPVETFRVNVMGTVNLLEAVRQTDSVKAAIIVTSDKCYENQEWLWGYREEDALGGFDPYANSKACAELVTDSFRNAFFTHSDSPAHTAAIASVRAGNVIGGGDWAADRLVPDMIRAFTQAQPVIIRNPRAIRPWQHVLEPLAGYLTLAEKLYINGAVFASGWNFGSPAEDAQPVSWVVERLKSFWGEGASSRLDDTGHPHEANYLKLDCTKARELLHWQPQLNTESALSWTVEWYKAWHLGKDMREVTHHQIACYQELIDHE